MQHNVSFDVPPGDQKKIAAVVVRACSLMADLDRLSLAMDIAAVHANGCPLCLEDMLTGDTYHFVSDVDGIVRNVDRETGKLLHGFRPHFAATFSSPAHFANELLGGMTLPRPIGAPPMHARPVQLVPDDEPNEPK